MTRKVVISDSHGGFGLSLKALDMLAELKDYDKLHHYSLCLDDKLYKKHAAEDQGKFRYSMVNMLTLIKDVGDSFTQDMENEYYTKFIFDPDFERHDEDLIKVVETLGEEVNVFYSSLKVVEIPKDIEYQIEDYDGMEWVAEKHRTWS